MTLLHLDLSTGVSGDMLLAALLDTGIPLDFLRQGLSGLALKGYELELVEKKVSSIRTSHLTVTQTQDQPLRHLSDLTAIVTGGGLPQPVEERSLATLRLLAEAEAKVHGADVESIHFHEIGAVDTVVDIVGAHLLVEHLGPARVTATPVNLGSGFVTIAHGRLPVPAPACAELAKGMRTFGSQLPRETATPTGLALVKILAGQFCPQPEGTVRAVGYGSGTLSGDDFPTYVRAFILDI